jgi:hypothetical protein
MAKTPKKPKQREDLNQLAARIVAEATGQQAKTPEPDAGKDAKAIKRGRTGGKKGGMARAAKLSPKERSEIAKKAAAARWDRSQD